VVACVDVHGICSAGRSAGGVFPGETGNEAESACGDQE